MGITLYAFIYGQVPFYDDNIVGLYSKIRHQSVEFPQTAIISAQLKDLIEKMLVKDPTKRITLPEIKVRKYIYILVCWKSNFERFCRSMCG